MREVRRRYVAPRKGCVSRNGVVCRWSIVSAVAPRKGCVSRNKCNRKFLLPNIVAPRKGCVSRNMMRFIR